MMLTTKLRIINRHIQISPQMVPLTKKKQPQLFFNNYSSNSITIKDLELFKLILICPQESVGGLAPVLLMGSLTKLLLLLKVTVPLVRISRIKNPRVKKDNNKLIMRLQKICRIILHLRFIPINLDNSREKLLNSMARATF